MESNTWFTIGKVTGVHGLAGNLKVWSFAESVETFGKGCQVLLKTPEEETGNPFTIAKASPQKKGVLLTLEKITSRELAESLVGKEILIEKEQLPELEKDTWYWQDLYGLAVIDETLGPLGTIERIFPTGANDVLVVVGKDREKGETEVLIPMHSHFVAKVDLDAGIMETTLPEGYGT